MTFSNILNAKMDDAKAPSETTQAHTPEQAAFIEAVTNGNANILLDAVAGSGKTTTMIAAAHELVKKNPGSVLACAFNKSTADELKLRMPMGITCATMHSIGMKTFGTLQRKVKVDAGKMNNIYKELLSDDREEDKWGNLSQCVNLAKSIGFNPNIDPNQGEAEIKRYMECLEGYDVPYKRVTQMDFMQLIVRALQISISQALTQGIIDFDDMLYMPVLYKDDCRWEQYDVILIDEVQDLSSIQHTMLKQIIKPTGRLIAVGDPKQAIYGFRGALADSIPVLVKEFNMTQMPLTYNFRCGTRIITEAQEFVQHIRAWPGAKEGAVENLKLDWDVTQLPKDAVILCRSVAPLVNLFFKAAKQGIATKFIGKDLAKAFYPVIKKLDRFQKFSLLEKLDAWADRETAKYDPEKEPQKIGKVNDIHAVLSIIVAESGLTTTSALKLKVDDMFRPKIGTMLSLCTIHKAKGLEWPEVYWLNREQLPLHFIVELAETNPDNFGWMLEQEYNCMYIASTRAKNKLTYISLARPKRNR
jgi:DNA helicase-2/ATP-dependent DNA helicase PcrA